jgi:hypothetical protein
VGVKPAGIRWSTATTATHQVAVFDSLEGERAQAAEHAPQLLLLPGAGAAIQPLELVRVAVHVGEQPAPPP